jgi:heme/copper-type cytochrome/quinol oxidase subunit 4
MRKITLMVLVMVFFGPSGTAFSEGMWCFFPKEDLNIYKEPSTNSQVVGVFKRQIVVMKSVTGKYPGWIELKGGQLQSIGWIERRGIMEYCASLQEADLKFSKYKDEASQPSEPEQPQIKEVIELDTQPVTKPTETQEEKEKKAQETAKKIVWFVLAVFLAIIYFLPSIIGRKKKNARAILALNILLGLFLLGTSLAILFFLPSIVGGIAVFILFGSTVAGWIVALVWAYCKD